MFAQTSQITMGGWAEEHLEEQAMLPIDSLREVMLILISLHCTSISCSLKFE